MEIQRRFDEDLGNAKKTEIDLLNESNLRETWTGSRSCSTRSWTSSSRPSWWATSAASARRSSSRPTPPPLPGPSPDGADPRLRPDGRLRPGVGGGLRGRSAGRAAPLARGDASGPGPPRARPDPAAPRGPARRGGGRRPDQPCDAPVAPGRGLPVGPDQPRVPPAKPAPRSSWSPARIPATARPPRPATWRSAWPRPGGGSSWSTPTSGRRPSTSSTTSAGTAGSSTSSRACCRSTGSCSRPPVENLDLLAAGPEVHNPAELLASRRLADFLDEARRTYDVDHPRLLPAPGRHRPPILAAAADGIVLVVRVSEIRRHDAERTAELLKALKTPVLGTVINGVRPGTRGRLRLRLRDARRNGPADRSRAPLAAATDRPSTNGPPESDLLALLFEGHPGRHPAKTNRTRRPLIP